MDKYDILLNHSWDMRDESRVESKLEWVSDYIFGFTTYDSAKSELFAANALAVCDAISNGETFEYIKDDAQYNNYLMMCNTPFFADKLTWGGSIRGAWWDAPIKLESCGLWVKDEQILEFEFTIEEWVEFLNAVKRLTSS
jgi:hypothetical protein